MIGKNNSRYGIVVKGTKTAEKIRAANTGRVKSKEEIDKWKQTMGQNNLWLIGDRNPAKRTEVREKISVALTGNMIKERNPNWRGGTSFLPYGIDFDNYLKKLVRNRDSNVC
jgi:hypothetical protein